MTAGQGTRAVAPTRADARRVLVVNADDLGLSDGVNRGIIAAHEDGIVTSASLMVRRPAAAAAAALAESHPRLGVGLHLDFGEWAFREGEWVVVEQRVAPGDARGAALEVDAQLELFRDLIGRDPTHIDSHQHVHLGEPFRSAALRASRALDVPLRRVTPGVAYEGGFYGRARRNEPYPEGITPRNLVRLIERLPVGVTELSCHPAAAGEEDGYGPERLVELRALCDAEVTAAVLGKGVVLRSFHDWKDEVAA